MISRANWNLFVSRINRLTGLLLSVHYGTKLSPGYNEILLSAGNDVIFCVSRKYYYQLDIAECCYQQDTKERKLSAGQNGILFAAEHN
jgi:hypothetical protein